MRMIIFISQWALLRVLSLSFMVTQLSTLSKAYASVCLYFPYSSKFLAATLDAMIHGRQLLLVFYNRSLHPPVVITLCQIAISKQLRRPSHESWRLGTQSPFVFSENIIKANLTALWLEIPSVLARQSRLSFDHNVFIAFHARNLGFGFSLNTFIPYSQQLFFCFLAKFSFRVGAIGDESQSHKL